MTCSFNNSLGVMPMKITEDNYLEQMLSCLNETDRSLFLKLYVEEADINEVSRETGMKKSSIYNRLSRGKKHIREMHCKKREV